MKLNSKFVVAIPSALFGAGLAVLISSLLSVYNCPVTDCSEQELKLLEQKVNIGLVLFGTSAVTGTAAALYISRRRNTSKE